MLLFYHFLILFFKFTDNNDVLLYNKLVVLFVSKNKKHNFFLYLDYQYILLLHYILSI